MMRVLNIFFTTVFIALLVGIAGLVVGSMLPIPGNIELKIVKSGSMEPTIPTGSLVVVKPMSTYATGDIITFGEDTKTQIPTTHRIVAIAGEGVSALFTTKGDANEEQDAKQTPKRDIIGKVVFHAPYVGFILDFARQPLGFALLIGIPAGLIILEEMLTIAKEAGAALRRRRRGGFDDEPGGGNVSVDGDGAPLRFTMGRRFVMDEIFVPMYLTPTLFQSEWWHKRFRLHKDVYGTSTFIVLGLMFVSSMMAGGAGGTVAYFSDIERSIGNIFRAGEWTPEFGTFHDIVLNEFLPFPDGVAYGFDFGNDGSNQPQGEWIELYNKGTLPVDVNGWYMTDASGGVGNTHAVINTTNINASTTIIYPGEWLVVYLNKPSLNNTGDSIFLYTSTTSGAFLVDDYTYNNPSDYCFFEPTPGDGNPTSTSTASGVPGNGNNGDCNQAQVAPNKSYARIPDGTGAWVDPIPTPGSYNIPEPEPSQGASTLPLSAPEDSTPEEISTTTPEVESGADESTIEPQSGGSGDGSSPPEQAPEEGSEEVVESEEEVPEVGVQESEEHAEETPPQEEGEQKPLEEEVIETEPQADSQTDTASEEQQAVAPEPVNESTTTNEPDPVPEPQTEPPQATPSE